MEDQSYDALLDTALRPWLSNDINFTRVRPDMLCRVVASFMRIEKAGKGASTFMLTHHVSNHVLVQFVINDHS